MRKKGVRHNRNPLKAVQASGPLPKLLIPKGHSRRSIKRPSLQNALNDPTHTLEADFCAIFNAFKPSALGLPSEVVPISYMDWVIDGTDSEQYTTTTVNTFEFDIGEGNATHA